MILILIWIFTQTNRNVKCQEWNSLTLSVSFCDPCVLNCINLPPVIWFWVTKDMKSCLIRHLLLVLVSFGHFGFSCNLGYCHGWYSGRRTVTFCQAVWIIAPLIPYIWEPWHIRLVQACISSLLSPIWSNGWFLYKEDKTLEFINWWEWMLFGWQLFTTMMHSFGQIYSDYIWLSTKPVTTV